MAYQKTQWINDQYDTPPDTYTIEDLSGGLFRIKRAGNRTQIGTPLSADNLNKLETQYDAAKADLDAHKGAATLDHPDGSVTDAKIGTRTPDQTVQAASGPQTLGTLLSMLANRIKAIIGSSNWYDAPATTLAAASTHAASTAAGTHGSATGATANTLAHRDANGDLTARVLRSTVAAGTAPLSVASSDMVANLNADMVDGVHGSDLVPVKGTLADTTSSIAAGGTLTKTIPLGRAATHGIAVLRSGPYGAIVAFTSVASEARGWVQYVDAGNVTRTQFESGAAWGQSGVKTWFGSGSYIKLDSIAISGTDLAIVFRNVDTAAHTINVECTWEVW